MHVCIRYGSPLVRTRYEFEPVQVHMVERRLLKLSVLSKVSNKLVSAGETWHMICAGALSCWTYFILYIAFIL
jgi:hypothetical protein